MKDVKLILGTMTFGESVFSPDVEAFINTFLDAGYDELDTAYVYNEGNCERLLGEVLFLFLVDFHAVPDGVLKLGFIDDGAAMHPFQ